MRSYLDIVSNVLKNGQMKGNRTGTRTLATFCEVFRHDMSTGFPLLTTKQMPSKTIAVELEGFIGGITDKKWYQERRCKIWNEWCNPTLVDKHPIMQEFSYNEAEPLEDLESEWNSRKKASQKEIMDLGPIYGANWRNFDGWYKPTPQIYNNFIKKTVEDQSGFVINTSKMIGKKFSSNNYGDFVVLNEYYIDKNQKFDIQFIETNNIQESRTKQNILNGEVFDSWYPSVYNVGCMGDVDFCKKDSLFKELRIMWESMLSRCYNPNDRCYNIYGGKGVYVSNDWLVLSNFIRDIRKLEHWEQKVNDWSGWSLDKDFYQEGYYSKNTCLFLSKSQQVQYSERFNESINKDLYKKGIDQLKKVVDTLKTNPNDRRMVVSAWNPNQIDHMALPPCHYAFTLVHINGVLNLCWKQRSCDLMLGVPFNIASYALLLELLCKESGLIPGELVGVLEDCHIYENQIEPAKEQVKREPLKLPQLNITGEDFDIFNWTHQDFKLESYNHHPKIDFGAVAV